MQTYTTIILSSLLGVGFATSAQAIPYQSIEGLQSTAAQQMLSAQTQQKGERAPERGSGRRDFIDQNVYTDLLQEF